MAQDDKPIPLDEEPLTIEPGRSPGLGGQSQPGQQGSSKIHAFGSATAGAIKRAAEFKRPLNLTGAGATRCRVFNSKVTVAAIDHVVSTINEWLDSNQIELKFINQVVGVMEGKTLEPNLIITVWY